MSFKEILKRFNDVLGSINDVMYTYILIILLVGVGTGNIAGIATAIAAGATFVIWGGVHRIGFLFGMESCGRYQGAYGNCKYCCDFPFGECSHKGIKGLRSTEKARQESGVPGEKCRSDRDRLDRG